MFFFYKFLYSRSLNCSSKNSKKALKRPVLFVVAQDWYSLKLGVTSIIFFAELVFCSFVSRWWICQLILFCANSLDNDRRLDSRLCSCRYWSVYRFILSMFFV